MTDEPHGRPRVLAIAGSLRRDSWNRRLLRALADDPPVPLAVTVVDDLATVPLFDEDLESDVPEAVRRLRRRVTEADGVLFATPEYNQSLPGVLKNTLDWLSRPPRESCLVGKPVALTGATPGPWGTRLAQKELRHVLGVIGARVLPQPMVYLREIARRFDERGRLTDPSARKALAGLLSAFAEWIDRAAREKE